MKSRLKQWLHSIRVKASQLVFVPIDHPSLDTESIIYKAAHLIASEQIVGDYLEFGVFEGASSMSAFYTLRAVFNLFSMPSAGRTINDCANISTLFQQMRFFAFDSYQGLPELQGKDQLGHDFAKGKFAASEALFRNRLLAANIPLNQIVIVPGWFEQTCTTQTIQEHQAKSVAIVHIDCDLYESSKVVLEFVKPLLTDGTILIFDDWYCFRGNPHMGEQRAFSEWIDTDILPLHTFRMELSDAK